MKKMLVIVDSLSKKKIISKFLGDDYLVFSVRGTLRELSRMRFSVDLEHDFQPHFIMTLAQQDTLRRLIQASSISDQIIIATDPDARGEAIAQHIAEQIADDNRHVRRIRLYDITKSALSQAIKKPQRIDGALAKAYDARRAMDHIILHKVCPLISGALNRPVRMDGIQSLALRLLCERENEIENFNAKGHWSLSAKLQKGKFAPFIADLVQLKGKKPAIPSEHHAEAILIDLKGERFKVKDIATGQIPHKAPEAFIGVSLILEASSRFGFSAKKTMIVARQLYEGIEVNDGSAMGLISYMHTDKAKVAAKDRIEARELILVDYGKEYLPDTAPGASTKNGAAKSPEAIRPTDVKRTPKKVKKYLTQEQFKLYSLIWTRFVASQMADALLQQTTVDLTTEHGEKYLFRASTTEILFRGYLQVYEDGFGENQGKTAVKLPRDLHIGEFLRNVEWIPKKQLTEPPQRFTESSLMEELHRFHLGRSESYASLLGSLLMSGFVERIHHHLVPTQIGRVAGNLFIELLPDICNIGYVSKVDDELAQIERDAKEYQTVLTNLYKPLSRAIETVVAQFSGVPPASDKSEKEICPLCGANLVKKWGRYGSYHACVLYPSQCRFTKTAEATTDHVQQKCIKCGKAMVTRIGKYGKFLGCSGFPTCDYTCSFPVNVKCPAEGCTGEIVERSTSRGKKFFGCSLYPKCDFSSWQKPENIVCPSCGNLYLVTHSTQTKGVFLRCPHCEAKYDLDLLPIKDHAIQPSPA